MEITAVLPAVAGLLGIGFGAALQYRTGFNLDRGRHFQELRSAAYVDLVRATAALAIRRPGGKTETARDTLTEVTDAKARIVLYGSERVIAALANFCRTDQHLASSSARQAFLDLAAAMRRDSAGRATEVVAEGDLATVLFGVDPAFVETR